MTEPLRDKTRKKLNRIKNKLPPGYFYLRDIDTDKIYYARIVLPGLRPERDPEIIIKEKVIDEREIELGDEIYREKNIYWLEEGFCPPINPPVAKLKIEKKGEFNVIAGVDLPKIDVEQLFEEILDYLRKHLWFRNDEEYVVVACWILATWIKELFPIYSYLALIGPYGSGKSRVLDVLYQLSYNSIYAASASSAVVPRLIEHYDATVLIDEAQLLKSRDKDELVAILNNGYKRGGVYVRAAKEGEDENIWRVAGFKAFAAPEMLVKSLQARCIEINMMEVPRPNLINFTVDEDMAKRLRAKLFAYRVRKIFKENEIDVENLACKLYDEGVVNRRICEIAISLYYVCPDKYKQYLVKYLKDLSGKKRDEKYASLDAVIIEELIGLEGDVSGGKLPVKRITEAVNIHLDLDEKTKYDPRTIGRRLKTLGFRKTRISHGVRAIVYDKKLIGDLALRYGISLPLPWSDVSDVSDVSGDIKNNISCKNDAENLQCDCKS